MSSLQFRQVLSPPLGRYIISVSWGSPIWVLWFLYLLNFSTSSCLSSLGCLANMAVHALMMAGWYTGRGGMEFDRIFTIFQFYIFLRLGGISMEDWKEKTRFGCRLGGENEKVSCGEIERDFCFVGKNDEFSLWQTWREGIFLEWDIMFFLRSFLAGLVFWMNWI